MSNNNVNNLDKIVNVEYLSPENAQFTRSANGFLQLKARVKIPENILEKENKENNNVGAGSSRPKDGDNVGDDALVVPKNDGENENKSEELKELFFERVFLHRAFPFDKPFEFIAVSGQFPKTEAQLAKEKKEREEKQEKERKEAEEKAKNVGDNAPVVPDKDKKENDNENVNTLGDLKEIGIIKDIKIFDKEQCSWLEEELHKKYFTPKIDLIYSAKERYGYSYWEVNTDLGKIKFTVHDASRNIIKITDDRLIVTDVNGNRYEIESLRKLDVKSVRKIEIYL